MKTTKKQFEEFKEECEKWIEFFGLRDWHIDICHEDIGKNAIARCGRLYEDKLAEISYNLNMDDDIRYSIKETAFHEVCHVLLGEFALLAQDPKAREEELENAEHTIVQKLVNSVYKNLAK